MRAWERFEAEYRLWEREMIRSLTTLSSAGMTGGKTEPGGAIRAAVLAAACGAAGFGAALAAALAAGINGAGAYAAGAIGAALAALAALTLAATPRLARRRGRSRGAARPQAEASLAAQRLASCGQRAADALGALIDRPPDAAAPFAPPAPSALPGDAQLAAAAALHSRLQRALHARLDALRERGRTAERLLEHARRLERIRALRAERRAAADAAAARLQSLRDDWRTWLTSRGLPGSLSPEAALELLDRLEQAAARLAARGRLDARLFEASARLGAFRAEVEALSGADPAAADAAGRDPAAALELLRAAIRREAEAAARREALEERRDELALRLREIETLLAEHDGTAHNWFTAAGAVDEAGYERLLAEAREARELDEERIRIEVELESGLNAEERTRLDELLATHDETALTELAGQAAEDCRAAEEERARLLELRGRLRETLDRLQREDARRTLREEREAAAGRIAAETERYAELAVMHALIRRTRRLFESERQPAVLRRASEYASVLTNGRYVRIAAPHGKATIELESAADGRSIDAAFLSRGAAEQIYLAIRLALADAVETDEPLPMLLDDLFVNYDAERLDAAARLLARIVRERRRQLIILTCHRHTAERLAERMPFAKRTLLAP